MLCVMTPTPTVLILWLAFAHYVVFICRGDVGDFVTKDIFNEIVLGDVPLSSGGIEDIVTQAFFHGILSGAADGCEGKNFYTYNDFIVATNAFSSFGTTGNSLLSSLTLLTRLAVWFTYIISLSINMISEFIDIRNWLFTYVNKYNDSLTGFCYIKEINKRDYCDSSNKQYPCVTGKQYYGRGPIQLTWYGFLVTY